MPYHAPDCARPASKILNLLTLPGGLLSSLLANRTIRSSRRPPDHPKPASRVQPHLKGFCLTIGFRVGAVRRWTHDWLSQEPYSRSADRHLAADLRLRARLGFSVRR